MKQIDNCGWMPRRLKQESIGVHSPRNKDVRLLLSYRLTDVSSTKRNKKVTETVEEYVPGHVDLLIPAHEFNVGAWNNHKIKFEPVACVPIAVHPDCDVFMLVRKILN